MKKKSAKALVSGWNKRYFILDLTNCTLSYKISDQAKNIKFSLPIQNIIRYTTTYAVKSPIGWPYGFEIYWLYKQFTLFSNDVSKYSAWVAALDAIRSIIEKPLSSNKMVNHIR